ncbi:MULTISPECIES: UDP-2,4-diacetamido-2,4,6-trideoxy-beta-L-altropyranose hydrolase [unclassified Maridesulfovibrio]|uniref:UDP-2,4-diacetamido-2,4, 6-trideoxy-beta-L-altropyranose hydrolase n=1 Tax=unclassified Maridesulfovibrio TaxID=2794999 RepID=UPI003B414BBD
MTDLNGRKLIIHANGSNKIGTGHVMRCIALAQEWISRGGRAIFVGHIEGENLAKRILDAKAQFSSLPEDSSQQEIVNRLLAAIQDSPKGSWIAIDSYDFTSESQRELKERFQRVLLVDDYHHQPEYYASLILNQNIGAGEITYKAKRDCTILAGTDYVMLRNEFRASLSKKRKSDGYRILITMGGADEGNITRSVLEALESLNRDDISATAVLGPANRNRENIDDFARRTNMALETLQNINNMPELISDSDLVVSAGGSTCWEICALKKPMAVIITAENQQRLTLELEKNGAALNLGHAEDIRLRQLADNIANLLDSAPQRELMATTANKLVDGNGVKRIVDTMSEELILRNAVQDDCAMILEWANDPETRKWSFNQNPITLTEHEKWYAARLANPEAVYLIAENGLGDAVGQIRFEEIEEGYEVHVLVSRQFRGGGTGSRLIRKASLHLLERKGDRQILARAKSDNIASVKAFKKAGYRITAEQDFFGSPSVIMTFFDDK